MLGVICINTEVIHSFIHCNISFTEDAGSDVNTSAMSMMSDASETVSSSDMSGSEDAGSDASDMSVSPGSGS